MKDKNRIKNNIDAVHAELRSYSREALPNDEQAQQIVSLFENNYPEMYAEELRKSDLSRYATLEQIRAQIKDGNEFQVAELNQKPIAFSKFRLENRHTLPDAEEWLCSWLIVEEPYRRLGVGERLLETKLAELRTHGKESRKRLFVIADVHKDNQASRELFKKAGFLEKAGKSPDFILVTKEVTA
jgi:ribosomal protein S18 acetylase RimI-like enzyme